jgi:hypothetical protein
MPIVTRTRNSTNRKVEMACIGRYRFSKRP